MQLLIYLIVVFASQHEIETILQCKRQLLFQSFLGRLKFVNHVFKTTELDSKTNMTQYEGECTGLNFYRFTYDFHVIILTFSCNDELSVKLQIFFDSLVNRLKFDAIQDEFLNYELCYYEYKKFLEIFYNKNIVSIKDSKNFAIRYYFFLRVKYCNIINMKFIWPEIHLAFFYVYSLYEFMPVERIIDALIHFTLIYKYLQHLENFESLSFSKIYFFLENIFESLLPFFIIHDFFKKIKDNLNRMCGQQMTYEDRCSLYMNRNCSILYIVENQVLLNLKSQNELCAKFYNQKQWQTKMDNTLVFNQLDHLILAFY